MKSMSTIGWVALVLVIVGALNWGLVGFFDYDLVKGILGDGSAARVIFSIVGLAGLWVIYEAAANKES
jgi:uncharacterized membrane protein YuzA (DUF378 family)